MSGLFLNGRDLPALDVVLRAAGQVVVELDGYDYRTQSRQSDTQGFPAPGPFGWVIHHTASCLACAANDHRYLALGHASRPVSNVCLGMRDGVPVWGMVAAGASNTNGKGGPWRSSIGLVPQDQGNQYIGATEVSIDGQGETWPKKLTDALIAGHAAIAKAYGLKATDIIAHGEWAPGRKIDPAGPTEDATLGVSTGPTTLWRMDPLRARIAQAMAGPTIPETPEDDMTPDQAAQLQAVYDLIAPQGSWKPAVWTQTATGIPDAVAALAKKVDDLTKKVDGLVLLAENPPPVEVSVPTLAISLTGTAEVAEAPA